MQTSIRRYVVITALVTVSLVLAACNGSGSSASTGSARLAVVHPAAGKLNGVVAHGKSALHNPSHLGLTYMCAKGLSSAVIPFGTTVNYEGTTIGYNDDNDSVEVSDKQLDIFQTEVTLTLSGNRSFFDSKVVSLIVMPQNNGDDFISIDQRVVNLDASVLKNTDGIKLITSDYSYYGWITDVKFCLRP